MSIDWIKQEATVVHELAGGVLVWSNPNIDIVITSEGVVLSASTGLPRNLLDINKSNQGYFAVNIRKDKTCTLKTYNASFSSLYSRIVLGKPLACGKVMRLIDKEKGYLPDNVQIVLARFPDLDYTTKEVDNTFKPAPKVADKPLGWMQKQGQPQQDIFEVKQANLCEEDVLDTKKEYNTAEQVFYTIVKGHQAFRTEDNAVFPTLELANWHQDTVSKGKGNAQVVLDYNGGWQLAEAIFGQDVKYPKERPYINFRDVMDNNEGVKDISEEDKASFKDMKKVFKEKGVDDKYINSQLYKLEYSLSEAEAIQAKLEDYCTKALAYQKALIDIKAATKTLNSEVWK